MIINIYLFYPQVRTRRMQLFALFEDYDRVHNGSVSRSQFRRVLSEIHIANLVACDGEWNALYEKFCVDIGGKDDFNYIAFCDTVNTLANFDTRRP